MVWIGILYRTDPKMYHDRRRSRPVVKEFYAQEA